MREVVFSITAHLDLLGFSAHLSLGSSDIRTKIGSEALERLRTLDIATGLAEKEINNFPDIYNFTIKNIRFNDSIYFVIDLRSDIIPPVGSIQLSGGGSISEFEKVIGKSIKGDDRVKEFYEYYAKEGLKVAIFLGLISRIHDHINNEELKRNYPGCITTISTGYRKIYINESVMEDYFSANFSLSNSYLTNSGGSNKGISGNALYVEDNVARIVKYDDECHKILHFSKFVLVGGTSDPYEKSIFLTKYSYSTSRKVEIEIFKQKYYYRELNTNVMSLFRMIALFKNLLSKGIKFNNVSLEKLLNCIREYPTDEIEGMDACEARMKYPILFLSVNLNENVEELEKSLLAEANE
jgi:hypothetical protein